MLPLSSFGTGLNDGVERSISQLSISMTHPTIMTRWNEQGANRLEDSQPRSLTTAAHTPALSFPFLMLRRFGSTLGSSCDPPGLMV